MGRKCNAVPTDTQTAIVEELKGGTKCNAELCHKYGLSSIALRNLMDSIGYNYPIYNPAPGYWAILGTEEGNK